jgi:DNA processing protein
MDWNEEKIFRAAILNIPRIGSRRLRQILAFYGSARNAWETRKMSSSELGDNSWLKDFFQGREKIEPEKVGLRLKKESISLVALGEEEYPCLLAECSDAPSLLFYKGVLKRNQEGLAIVGSRRATPYGKAAASYLAKKLVESGYVIVSGLARGIDTAAHQGALEGNGITWAFLAGGLDTLYPAENCSLAQQIMEKGALISEYPPGIPAEPGHFPARNRLISGSSRGVVVIEAAQRSGSLITADFALEQGREVFAVPGPIFSEQSRGTHNLLKMGAKLVAEKEDILSELPLSPKGNTETMVKPNHENCRDDIPLTGKANNETEKNWETILRYLSDLPLHIDRLTALCPLPAYEIALGLLELQLAGKIAQMPGQYYVLDRRN